MVGQDIIESLRKAKIDIFEAAENGQKSNIFAQETHTIEPFTHEKISVMFQPQKHKSKLIHITGTPIGGVQISTPSGISEASRPEMLIMNDTDKSVSIKKGDKLGRFEWAGNAIEKNYGEAEKLMLITHISQMDQTAAENMQQRIDKWKKERKKRVDQMEISEKDLDIAEVEECYRSQLLDILNNNKSAFSSKDGETGMSNYQYSIEFKDNETGDTNPPPLSKFYIKNYNYSAIRQTLLEGEIKKLLDAGTIGYSSSPSNLPTVLIVKTKEDGSKKVRLCIDFTKLNKHISVRKWAIQSTVTILRDISQSINNIKRAENKEIFFITSDITSAFSSIHLDTKTKLFTTFSTKNRSFFYYNLPFGIASAPASFVEVLTRITADLVNEYEGYIFLHMDDILILGSKQKILEIWNKLLKRFIEEGIILNIKKSSFFHKKVEFLGKNISEYPKSAHLFVTGSIRQSCV